MRLLILDPSFRSYLGHYLAYAGALSRAAFENGVTAVVFGHRDADSTLERASFILERTFRNDIWMSVPSSSYLSDENIGFQSEAFFEDAIDALQRFRPQPEDLLFYPTLTGAQLEGAGRLIEHFRGGRIRHDLLLRYQPELYLAPRVARAFRRIEAAAETEPVKLSTDSERLAYSYASLTSLRANVYPIPHTTEARAEGRNLLAQLHVVSLGNARGEKGIVEILEAVRLSAGNEWGARIRFTLQVNDPSEDAIAAIEAIRGAPDPRVSLIETHLDERAYLDLLHSADIVLTPYHRNVYQERTSGVFLEGVALGKVVVATDDSWMSHYIEAYGGGVTTPDRSAPALAKALRTVVEEFSQLSEKALAAAPLIRRIHNPQNLLAHLIAEDATPVTIPRRRRAAIITPWAELSGCTGASVRILLLARYLSEADFDVKILYLGDANLRISDRVTAEGVQVVGSDLAELREALSHLAAGADDAYAETFHLFHFGLPWLSETLKRRLLGAVRWADVVLVKYPYFMEIISDYCTQEGKKSYLTMYDLVQNVSSNVAVRHATRAFELEAMRKADRVYVSNTIEQRMCVADGIAAHLLPHPIDWERLRPLPADVVEAVTTLILDLPTGRPQIFLFVGGSHPPNVEAVRVIRAMAHTVAAEPRFSQALFVVVGDACAAAREPNFVALGRVSDLELHSLYQSALCVLIPLKGGTGVSIKAVEAMAHGRCILATDVGMRGLPVSPGEHCLIENDLERYPERLAEILECPNNARAIGGRARALAANYDYKAVFRSYELAGSVAAAVKPELQIPYSDLLARATTSKRPDALVWLLGKLNISALDSRSLERLAYGCRRHFPKRADIAEQIRLVRGTKEQGQLECAIDDWLTGDSKTGKPTQESATRLHAAMKAQELDGHWETLVRARVKELTEAGRDAAALELLTFARRFMGGLTHPDAVLTECLAMDRIGYPTSAVLARLDEAFNLGLERTVGFLYRGRLRLLTGDVEGRNDLAKAAARGPRWAIEAEAALRRSNCFALALARLARPFNEILGRIRAARARAHRN